MFPGVDCGLWVSGEWPSKFQGTLLECEDRRRGSAIGLPRRVLRAEEGPGIDELDDDEELGLALLLMSHEVPSCTKYGPDLVSNSN